ncbi:TetR/AcrR family transcriptional regulator [Amycolatopsis sp. NPDC004378]
MTVDLLHEAGYDRLTIDEVAARAHASKATVYRRWPSKADLVIAAVANSMRVVAVPPDTGTLRGDLIHLGEVIARQGRFFGDTLASVLLEIRRNAKLRSVIEQGFLIERRPLVEEILRQAADRGEISHERVASEVWDLLPGYLIYRFLVPGPPITADTVRELVDDVLLPSLTRER